MAIPEMERLKLSITLPFLITRDRECEGWDHVIMVVTVIILAYEMSFSSPCKIHLLDPEVNLTW